MNLNTDKKGGMLRLYEILRDASVTRRAVRFYEEQGLLLPAGRDQYGRRIYVHSDLMRLKLIRALRTAGLSIAAIRDVLDSRAVRDGDSSPGSWIERVERVLLQYSEELRQQLLSMQEGEKEVLSAVSWLHEHREAVIAPDGDDDDGVPFIVRALMCQPSTLSTAPPAAPPARPESSEGFGFTPTW
jgi:DNA-binding transcriptional MerR regulator